MHENANGNRADPGNRILEYPDPVGHDGQSGVNFDRVEQVLIPFRPEKAIMIRIPQKRGFCGECALGLMTGIPVPAIPARRT